MHDIDGFAENSRGELVIWNCQAGQKISVFQPESGQKETRAIAEIPNLNGKLIRAWAQDTMVFLIMLAEKGKTVDVFRLSPGFSVQHLFGEPLSVDLTANFFLPPDPYPVVFF